MRTRPIQNSFTSGELSPRLEGRSDLEQYKNAVSQLQNFITLPHGGITGRSGFAYAAEAKYNDKKARLIPFEFSLTQAYILEFGYQYIRIFKDHGQVIHTTELIANGTMEADSNWSNYGTPTVNERSSEQIKFGSYSRKFTANAAWDGVKSDTFTTVISEKYWLECWVYPVDATEVHILIRKGDDSDWDYTVAHSGLTANSWNRIRVQYTCATGGAGAFLAFSSNTTVTTGTWYVDNASLVGYVDITSPYSETEVADLYYTQSADTLYLTHGSHAPKKLTRSSHIDWTLSTIDFIDGPYLDENTDSSKTVTSSGTTGTITVTATGFTWDAGQVGALWRIKVSSAWGYVKLTNKVSDTVMDAEVIEDLDGTTATAAWREGCWSTYRGFPRCVTFFEGRLFFAGTDYQPQTIWGSQSANFETFTPGVDDDDAVQYTLGSDQVNVIQWIAPSTQLIIGTAAGEFKVYGGPNSILTPTSVRAISPTNIGGKHLRPHRVGSAILFVQRAGKKVIEYIYSLETDNYSDTDLTELAEHITGDGIVWTAYQQEPDSIMWAGRADGTLLGMTRRREQKVLGWHRHPTDGSCESGCVIPTPDGKAEELWCLISRTIEGSTRRYIEYLDPSIKVDSGLTYSGSAVTTLSGLEHLEGKTVTIVGDDAVYPSQIVTKGKITVDPSLEEAYIGLSYQPYLKTLRPEIELRDGTSLGRKRRWARIAVRVYQTLGLKIFDETIPFRSSADEMDQPPEVYSGVIWKANLGWSEDGFIEITQEQPLPVTILSITGVLEIND